MRSSKSRSRNKSNRNNNRSVGNVVNRVFDSSGPEGKVRGTPQQIMDKYNQLARDAQLSNDRVAAENFQQHAEHYLRMLTEAQREQAERQAQQQSQQNSNQNNPQHNNQQGNQSPNQNNNQNNNQNAQNTQNDQPNTQGENQSPQGSDVRSPDNVAPKADKPKRRPRKAQDGDVIDIRSDSSDDSGLVETPEEKPQRPKRTRQKAVQETPAPEQPVTPDAAE